MSRWFVTLLLPFVFTACAAHPSSVPTGLEGVPWRGTGVGRGVLEARELVDRGDHVTALALLDELLARHPRHVDAHRVRQDLLRQRGRVGLVFAEAEQRLLEWGQQDPDAIYLWGRLQNSMEDKRHAFERVLRHRPTAFWGWFGLAFTYRNTDRETALGIYASLHEGSEGHPLVSVAYAELLRSSGEHDKAIEVYEGLRGVPTMAGVAERGIAETMLAAGKRRDAWAPLLSAMRLRPSDPGLHRVVHELLAGGLARQQIEQLLDVLYEDPKRLEEFGRRAGASLLAELFERVGHLPAARDALSRSDERPLSAAALRHRRQQRLAVGDVAGFLAELSTATPQDLVRDESNHVRGRWVKLLDGAWMRSEDPLADRARATDLCHALLDCGLLLESDIVATLALGRHERAEKIRAIRDEVRREIAFEGAIRRVLYRGYHSEARPIDEVLEDLRGVSRRILGEDVIGEPEIYSVPLVGRLVDPFDSDLALHLAKYNRHLLLGQRWVGSVEGLLLTRLAVHELEASDDLPLDGRCMRVVGDDRQIQALGGVLGGDLAGVAVLSQYVIDYDAVRDWAASILERREIARADDLALLDDPVPSGLDPLDPVDTEWRLSLLSPVEDSRLEAAVFDMICAHERAHLVDSFYFLPPGSNLWRTLQLVVAHGFSPLSIESEMEARAEAGALLESPHTALVLAHIAGFLANENPGSPHSVGFRRLAQHIHDHLAEDPEFADRARVVDWPAVPAERMRAIAREVLRR